MNDEGWADPRLAVRFVDLHSGRNDILGGTPSVGAMLETVSLALEAGRAGSRFPLLQLLRRQAPLSAPECEALVREVTRLKSVLTPLPLQQLHLAPRTTEAPDAPPPLAIPEIFPRLNGNGAPRNLAEEFAWPLFVIDHVGRLGAASGRGARFETGNVDALRSLRTPLSPYAAAPALAR